LLSPRLAVSPFLIGALCGRLRARPRGSVPARPRTRNSSRACLIWRRSDAFALEVEEAYTSPHQNISSQRSRASDAR